MSLLDEQFKEELSNRLNVFLRGNLDAIEYCLSVYKIIQVWDDLIDRDKPIDPEDINTAFRLAMIDIPSNPFFVRFSVHLIPTFLGVILQWHDANILEKSGDPHSVDMAFMLRAAYFQVISTCAYLIGGEKWAREAGPHIRKLYGENIDDFRKEMEQCQHGPQQSQQ